MGKFLAKTEWFDEVRVFTRAFSGAAVFGIPLAFTMEMWWIGKTLSISTLLLVLAIGLLANFGLAYVAGFRTDHSLAMAVDQAVDALAVGILSAGFLLFTLNQLRLSDGFEQGVGMVMLLAIPLSLGASVAHEVFRDRDSRIGEDQSELTVWQGVIADIGATIIGGIFIGMSIAPTDEVTLIAAGVTQFHLFAIIAASLLFSYLIVFASGFDEVSPPGPFHHPLTETVLTYVVALAAAFGMLLMFERVTLEDPANEIIRQTIVFALPVAVGGAGGRLVI